LIEINIYGAIFLNPFRGTTYSACKARLRPMTPPYIMDLYRWRFKMGHPI